MSFFGFDPTVQKDRSHPTAAPGFSSAPDPFASFSQNRDLEDDEDEAYVDQAFERFEKER